MLAEDIKVREYLKKKLKNASVVAHPDRASRQERPHHDLLGSSGRRDRQEGRRHRRPEVATGKQLGVPVHVNIEEMRKPEIDAQLIAD